jgi:beta-lactamase class A
MVGLLVDLQRGRFLTAKSRNLLLKIMAESTTGPRRLRAGIPKGSILAHKTGTGRRIDGIAGAVNDAGIVTLPNGRRFVVAVFLKGTSGTTETRERVIADVARAAVDALR